MAGSEPLTKPAHSVKLPWVSPIINIIVIIPFRFTANSRFLYYSILQPYFSQKCFKIVIHFHNSITKSA